MRGWGVLLVLAACATPVGGGGRVVVPRSELKMPQSLLPKHGIYAAGGGLTSTPWRVVVDLDAHHLTAGSGAAEGHSSAGPLATTWDRDLTAEETAAVGGLAESAWRAPIPLNTSPTADYDEVVAVVDGDAAYWAEGFGPLAGPPGAVVAEMRKLAGNPP